MLVRSPGWVLVANELPKKVVAVAKKGSWSPPTTKKGVNGRQERFLEPANPKKRRQRSPRKVLGARQPQKKASTVAKKGSWSPPTLKKVSTVAKKGSWSPQTPKKGINGRQERFLEPANHQKRRQRSPRKVLGARQP
jgi:hypothetical protein